jgi:hypothetical protein
MCLVHASTSTAYLEGSKIKSKNSSVPKTIVKAVELSDSDEYARQQPKMEEQWRKAIEDVVMRMYAIEKDETKKNADNPLAFLSRGAPRLDVSSIVAKGPYTQHGSNAGSSLSRPGQRRSKANIARDKEKQFHASLLRKNIWNMKGSKAAEEEVIAEELERKKKEEENMKTGNISEGSGEACSSCGSKRTVSEVLGGWGNVTYNETWGSKDQPDDLTRTTCLSCGHTTTTRD